MSIVPAPIARQPWQALIPLTALVIFGSLVLYSAGGGGWEPYASGHLIQYALFIVMAFVMTRFSRAFAKFAAYPIYAVIVVLLMLVEAMGFVGGGSQRWINLGFMMLQPSELMKPAIVLALARFYDDLPVGMVPTWRALVPAGVIIGFPVVLVLLQPDLGTALAIAFGGAIVMFLAGLPLRWFMMAGGAAAIMAPLAFFFGLHDYQRKRVFTFLDPESDPLGDGYHITQSKIAIGSGGFTGKGFGEGSQSHLNYLPEPHTDFAFATMAEEWGLLGGLFILVVFGMILRWGLSVALASNDRFGRLLAAGMTATIFFYIAINLMMVMGLAPVVGVPLPLVSFGGSAVMTVMLCLGLLMALERHQRTGASTLA